MRRARRRTAPALAAAAALLLAPAAQAQEWSVRGFFSERLEAGDGADEDALRLLSRTDLGLTFSAATPRARIAFAPGVSALVSTDEGVGPEALAPRFSGSLVLPRPRSQTSLSLALTPRFVTGSEGGEIVFTDEGTLERLETIEEDAVQLSATARLAHSYKASPRDTLSFAASARAREYLTDVSALEATRSFGLDAGWTRQLDPRTSLSLSPSFQQFYSSGDGSDGRTVSLVAGASRQVNQAISINGALGPSWTTTSEDEEDGADEDDSSSASASGLGLIGNIGARYQGTRTSLSFRLAQTVEQDVDGEIANRLTLGASAGRQITSRSRLSLSAGLGFANPLFQDEEGGDEAIVSLSPGYALTLTPDWSLNLGYRLSFRNDEEDGFEPSNAVFMQISRNLALLP